MTKPEARHAGDYAHLFVIYVVWGTAYLGMKLALGGPDPLTAFQLQAARLLLGGGIIAIIAWRARAFRPMTRRQWAVIALGALLFWIFGNGFAMLATRELPSAFVAMAMGTIPLWSIVFHALRDRRLPSAPGAVLLGFAGLLLIYLPALTATTDFAGVSVWGPLLLFLAPIGWVAATMLQGPLAGLDPMATASLQLMLGGVYAGVIALVEGVPLQAVPGTQSLIATLYLAVIGSALSFLSYVKAASRFSPRVVAAFAYVNPIVGVGLGWLVLGEKPAPVAFGGMALVTASVVLTLRAASRRR